MKLKSVALTTALGLLPLFACANSGWQNPLFQGTTWHPYIGVGAGFDNIRMNSTIENAYNWVTPGLSDQTNVTAKNYQQTPGLNLFAGVGTLFPNKVYVGFDFNASYLGLAGQNNMTAPTMVYSLNNSFFSYQRYYPQNISTTMNWAFQLDTVLGYQIDEHWMPYVMLGLSDTDVNASYYVPVSQKASFIPAPLPSSTAVSTSTHVNLLGANIGLGTRYYVDNHWFVKAETIFTYLYGTQSVPAVQEINGSPAITGSDPYTFKIEPYIWSADLGVGYQF